LDDRSVPNRDLDFICRPPAKDNLGPLIALWVLSWQEAMPEIDFEARRGWFQDHLRGLESSGFETVCLDRAGALIGFVILNPSTHEIDQLAVDPSAWGTGAAIRLLAESRALSPEMLLLDVNCDNLRAVRFYEREGFIRIGQGTNALSGLKTQRMRWTASPR